MKNDDPTSYYQAIGRALSAAAPRNWTSIRAEITLLDNRVDAVVSYISAEGTGHLTGVPMLARYFYELARVISSEDKGLFISCVFELQDSGKYDVAFGY